MFVDFSALKNNLSKINKIPKEKFIYALYIKHSSLITDHCCIKNTPINIH